MLSKPKRKKSIVSVGWDDCGVARIDRIECKCGHVETGELYVESGEQWKCPNCGNVIYFKWVGMAWKEVEA